MSQVCFLIPDREFIVKVVCLMLGVDIYLNTCRVFKKVVKLNFINSEYFKLSFKVN